MALLVVLAAPAQAAFSGTTNMVGETIGEVYRELDDDLPAQDERRELHEEYVEPTAKKASNETWALVNWYGENVAPLIPNVLPPLGDPVSFPGPSALQSSSHEETGRQSSRAADTGQAVGSGSHSAASPEGTPPALHHFEPRDEAAPVAPALHPSGARVEDQALQAVAVPMAALAATLLLAFLFSRLRKDRLTEHPVRDRIIQLLESRPGMRTYEVAQALDLSPNLVAYHVRMMVDHEMLQIDQNGRAQHLFIAGTPPATRRQHAALAHPRSQDVARFIRKNPGARLKDVHAAVGISTSLASWHLKRLREGGVIEAQGDGHARYVAVAAPAVA